MALAEQLVTVGAVLAGAAGTYLTSRLADRDRFTRELRVRWDERRLDAYVVYLTAVKNVYRCAQQALSALLDDDELKDRDALLAEMRAAEAERSRAFEQVMLLGDTPTIQAAHDLNDRLWKLERPARGAEEIGKDMWHERSDEWLVALNEFHSHAREGLAVSGELARRDVAQLLTRRSSPDR
ncbi:MAG TPA: hypothetical protein VGD53_00645 [Actinoallomurus sp.]